jgi:mxaJ protein
MKLLRSTPPGLRVLALLALALPGGGDPGAAPPRRVLEVCADPNNLPFSNDRLEGLENRLAELLARELGAELKYHWRAQRRGFFREGLDEGRADLVLGVPAGFERVLTTRPWFRSSYVFLTRADRALDLRSLDDPRLRSLRIGVQLVGDDGADTPPALALAQRGLADRLVGFTLYGDYREDSPPARIVDAVARGEVDIAAVWGPLAGYFAARSPVPLALQPIELPSDAGGLRFDFAIAVGVRKDEPALRDEIDAVLAAQSGAIDALLESFHVPRAGPLPAAGASR